MVIKIEMHVRQGAELDWGDEERVGALLLVWLWGLGPRSFFGLSWCLGRLIRPAEDRRHNFRAGGLKTCSVQRQSRPHAPAVWQRALLDYLALFRGIGMTTHLTVDPLHLRVETF
jgi:hypothetical protein